MTTSPPATLSLLPRGITGFRAHRETPLPSTNARAFRGHCHAVALQASAEVVSFIAASESTDCRNFAIGVFSLANEIVAAVLNGHHPILAFAEPPTDHDMRLRFRDCTPLAGAFESLGVYRIASLAELEVPPNPAALTELSTAERQQIAYWKPRCVGDVVFNWWD